VVRRGEEHNVQDLLPDKRDRETRVACDCCCGPSFNDEELVSKSSGKEELSGKDVGLKFATLVGTVVLDALQSHRR
jgi:hypothetical protein